MAFTNPVVLALALALGALVALSRHEAGEGAVRENRHHERLIRVVPPPQRRNAPTPGVATKHPG